MRILPLFASSESDGFMLQIETQGRVLVYFCNLSSLQTNFPKSVSNEDVSHIIANLPIKQNEATCDYVFRKYNRSEIVVTNDFSNPDSMLDKKFVNYLFKNFMGRLCFVDEFKILFPNIYVVIFEIKGDNHKHVSLVIREDEGLKIFCGFENDSIRYCVEKVRAKLPNDIVSTVYGISPKKGKMSSSYKSRNDPNLAEIDIVDLHDKSFIIKDVNLEKNVKNKGWIEV